MINPRVGCIYIKQEIAFFWFKLQNIIERCFSMIYMFTCCVLNVDLISCIFVNIFSFYNVLFFKGLFKCFYIYLFTIAKMSVAKVNDSLLDTFFMVS